MPNKRNPDRNESYDSDLPGFFLSLCGHNGILQPLQCQRKGIKKGVLNVIPPCHHFVSANACEALLEQNNQFTFFHL